MAPIAVAGRQKSWTVAERLQLRECLGPEGPQEDVQGHHGGELPCELSDIYTYFGSLLMHQFSMAKLYDAARSTTL